MTARTSLSPLIKWSGGKRSEIPVLQDIYPQTIERIVEPFTGGAAVSLQYNAPATVLNDVSKELINFYTTLKSPVEKPLFVNAVMVVHQVRQGITQYVQNLSNATVDSMFTDPKNTSELIPTAEIQKWVNMFPTELRKKLTNDLIDNINSKVLKRIPALEKKSQITFKTDDRRNHYETALQSGLYTTLRRVYNNAYPTLSSAWKTACWYVVRNLCYSGMFRYSKNGHFNVPYGGIGYNSRNFTTSLSYIASKPVGDFLSNADIHNMDFEMLFKQYNYFNTNDFIFVDPPYDSAFSQYNAEGDFTAEDQKRLAKTLLKTSAKWMLVIKNTPFILSLYQDKSLFRGVFCKNYQVNIRNRHDREVEHLVVTNYAFEDTDHIKRIK